jgi:hypothetical protein
MSADSFIQDILRNASALRAAGVLRLTVDGCSVELAPHQPEPDTSTDEDNEDDDPEHPAFNQKVKLRQYHQDNKTS